MGKEDIELLRQFGEEVKKSRKEDKTRKLKIHNRLSSIVSKENVLQLIKINKSFFSKSNLFLKKRLCILLNIIRETRHHFHNLLYKKKLNNQEIDNESKVLIEHQKQIGNISVIIRRRKKRSKSQQSFNSLRITRKSPVAYYFHRIDLTEKENKYVFNPQRSIWDFNYPLKINLVKRLKKFFSR